VKGLSLFVVPKFLVKEDGGIGSRNDVACVSIEHKLGIKASPTAVLQFGDAGGAVGYLVGEENRGLEYMFIMMNSARFSVGIQGVGLSERAYQQALAYACERQQGRDEGAGANPTEIINHPDVRRQLATMRASVEVSRALAYSAAAFDDLGKYSDDAFIRNSNAAKYEFMVPIVKGCCTEAAVDVASAGVQVHGGWDTSKRPVPRNITVTLVFFPSTKEQLVSRPRTLSVEKSREIRAGWVQALSPRWTRQFRSCKHMPE
jgi:alkylation response protein AidB-like acyl-CoA dehydrogenase